MSTTIVFSDTRIPLRETATTLTIGHFATPRFGWSVTAGGIVAGSVDGRDFRGGATLGGSVAWLPVYERPSRPFVAGSASFGTALIRTIAGDGTARSWSAWDVRAGAIVGKTFLGRLVPYLAARVFGGPVFWYRQGASAIGSDRYHVTVGLGLTLRLPARFDATLEVMPLGEQSATAGVSLHF
jgi:hypothetical protein